MPPALGDERKQVLLAKSRSDAALHKYAVTAEGHRQKQAEWQEHKTPDGRTYYHNSKTKATTWDKPAELKTSGEAQTPWKEYSSEDGSGKKYYYNTVTKKSVWEIPEELKKIREAAAMRQESQDEDAALTKAEEEVQAKVIAAARAKAEARAKEEAAARAKEEAARPPPKPAAPAQQPAAPAEGALAEQLQKAEKKVEPREAFRTLLREKGVGGSWSWAQAMSAIITDPRYQLLSTIGEKKQVFSEWASRRAQEEKVEKRARAKEVRPRPLLCFALCPH